MPGVTATLITLNESVNLAAALESVRWADEIIVVDSESTDGTVEIARRYTDKVFVRPWPGYIEQKNFAASQARNDWISRWTPTSGSRRHWPPTSPRCSRPGQRRPATACPE